MTLHLNTQADLEDAIHALVKQDPRLEAGIRDRGHAGAAAARARLCRPGRDRLRPAIVDRERRGDLGPPHAPRSIRFTMTRCGKARADRLGRLGLSAAKIKTLKNLAREIAAERLNLDVLANEDADAAHNTLTALHGIGPWTADVYLLFCLGHGDAWPAGDLAVQEAMKIGLGLKTRPTAKQMAPLAEPWRPLARRRGASVVDLLPGDEEARGRDRRTDQKTNAVLNKIAVAKPSSAKAKIAAGKHAGIENMKSTDFVVARDDLQQCKFIETQLPDAGHSPPMTRCWSSRSLRASPPTISPTRCSATS